MPLKTSMLAAVQLYLDKKRLAISACKPVISVVGGG
jgi:hypothetical protein